MTVKQLGKEAVDRAANKYMDTVNSCQAAQSTEDPRKSNEGLVDESEAEPAKEQPCLIGPRGRESRQEEPGKTTLSPWEWNPYYAGMMQGWRVVEEVDIVKVETTPEEKKHVIKALGLILQAARALQVKDMPDSMDRDHDMVWDWRQMTLSAREYAAFAHAIIQCQDLRSLIRIVSYDWTPLDSHEGILSVRKKCAFQSQLTRTLTDVIADFMYKNDILMSLVDSVWFETQHRVSVLTGTVEGMRTPCRCFRYKPKPRENSLDEGEDVEEDARPVDNIQDFVLEVGMGEKTRSLSALAHSYIERGTQCAMTVAMERDGEFDFDWSYSLYRRGQAKCCPGQVTRYEVVCAAQDARVEMDENGVVEFPVGLTVFDFIPAAVLEKNGVISPDDEKAVMKLTMSSEQLAKTRARKVSYYDVNSISEYLQDVVRFL